MSLKDLRELERADIEALRKAAPRERRRGAWSAWVAWWAKRARELKIAATVAGSAAALVGSVAGGWKALQLMRAHDAGKTELPPGTGSPSTALDFQVTASRPAPKDPPRPEKLTTKDPR